LVAEHNAAPCSRKKRRRSRRSERLQQPAASGMD
jgi:hypothetical protein